MNNPGSGHASGFLARAQQRLMDEYRDLVRIPSVSADPSRRADVRACAELIASRMRRIGLRDVQVAETPGHPVVSGHTPLVRDAPSYLVYAHYDVQPADPLDEWQTEPFDLVVVGDELRGRGVSDDKAHVHLHLAAAEALLETGVLPFNVMFVFEGEEEISSEHFPIWMGDHADALDDVSGIVVSDTTFLNRDRPSLGTGVRGLLYLELAVRTAEADLHSGGYGGAVPNAAETLTRILASLKDEQGRIRVPRFYDDVESDGRFVATLENLPFDEAEWLRGARLTGNRTVGEAGYSVLERLWTRPTLDINGMWSGYIGEGPKTVIPSLATAKVSCRLVQAQDPETVLNAIRAAVQSACPDWAEVKVTKLSSSSPATVDATSGLARAALDALEAGFGITPVLQREGGSIPVVGMLSRRMPSVPLILLGFSPPDDGAHGPNERMRLWNYHGGLATLTDFWGRLRDGP